MTQHVAVVGAGIVGLCAALYCVRRGFRVTVLERGSERRDGASFGNTGLIVPSHFVPLAAPGAVGRGLAWMLDRRSPFYIAPRASWTLIDWLWKFWRASSRAHVRRAAPLLRDLILASLEGHRALASQDARLKLVENGTLMLCRTRHAWEEEARTAADATALGLPARVLDAAQTAALDPDVRMDVVGSVYFPQDARVVPEDLIASLQQRLAGEGVTFVWGTEVCAWRREATSIRAALLAHAGQARREGLEADAFVLAAGSWSAGLARPLGLSLPMQAGKGYSLTLPQPRCMPKHAAILTEARVAVSPMPGALRIGGTMELAGLDPSIRAQRVRAIAAALPRYYPDIAADDFARVRPWQGLRPCSPDGLPYLGRTRRCPNLVVATGHAMLGVSLGPITGKLVAQMLAGEPPAIDPTLLSPDRFD